MTTAYFIGTSFTAGAGGLPDQYPTTMAAMMGWTATVDGVGGSGYTVGDLFIDRLPDLLAANPDVVVVEGGANDQPDDLPATVAALLSAASAFLASLRAGLPSAAIHVTASHRRYNDVAAGLAALTLGINGTWTDWSNGTQWAPAWITGTGNVADPHGDGNADIYLSADGAHLTSAGYVYVGARWARSLGARYVDALTTEAGSLIALESPT